MRVLFGPQGADFVSPELLLKIQKVAKERNTKIHMHVQQGRQRDLSDREEIRQETYGIFWTIWDIWTAPLIAVHLTDCNADEAALIAKRGSGNDSQSGFHRHNRRYSMS